MYAPGLDEYAYKSLIPLVLCWFSPSIQTDSQASNTTAINQSIVYVRWWNSYAALAG